MNLSEITFVAAEDELKGKRAAVVARFIELLVEAEGEPVTFAELTQGVEHPHQYTPALHALELVGVVDRWEYSTPGRSKVQHAWSLAEHIEVDRGEA